VSVNVKILVNHKNLSEVLAAYGIVILADCLGSGITRCRFTKTSTVICDDGIFRSMKFEFECPDYPSLVARIAALDICRVEDKVTLTEKGTEVLKLDWFDMGGFIGDKGNFFKADKLEFVTLHRDVFAELTGEKQDAASLFSLSTDAESTNYLANFNLKKNYIDAGGVYDSSDTEVFARDFLLLVALQSLRSVMTRLVNDRRIVYGLSTEWMAPAGFFAALTGVSRKRLEATVKGFGNYGLVLATAKEVA
jgi:hypothetical protein